MKRVFKSLADEYVCLHDEAADAWVLSHRAEYDAMAKEAFPAGWRPGEKGSTRQRMDFLNQQAAIRAGFPSYETWLSRTGHPTQQPSEAA